MNIFNSKVELYKQTLTLEKELACQKRVLKNLQEEVEGQKQAIESTRIKLIKVIERYKQL